MLLCDFHIHTTYSDGSVVLKKVVDFYGQAGFDVISITDHVVNGDNAMGKLAHRLKYSITPGNFDEYLEDVRAEARRAWDKYGMLVIPGIEITKNSFSSDKAAHLLIIDIKEFVPACWDFEKIFLEAKKQDSLTIACHPHQTSEKTFVDTLFLWNNRERYSKYIDAWEIANRDDVFNVISLKKYPYIANSDFHKPRHLYSWKTLLNCPKDLSLIKKCIKGNDGVSITLFRRCQKQW
ncbi:MAG: PHP domain-containing protein [Nitrospirota bacterium]